LSYEKSTGFASTKDAAVSRTVGARNAGHAERRAALIGRLRTRLANREIGQASLRELAASAGVSVPTLSHYFGTRQDIVAAVLAHSREEGEPHLAMAARPQGPFAQSVRQFLAYAAMGHLAGVSQLHVIGLTEGIGHAGLGPRYVEAILEPTLQAIEARLAAHVAAGEMRDVDLRHAALTLLSPLLLAQLHQGELNGSGCRPLDLDRFMEDHAAGFVRAYGAGQ
jgi:AcrR family transcriptional regulator